VAITFGIRTNSTDGCAAVAVSFQTRSRKQRAVTSVSSWFAILRAGASGRALSRAGGTVGL
jgi:hypothetical protein